MQSHTMPYIIGMTLHVDRRVCVLAPHWEGQIQTLGMADSSARREREDNNRCIYSPVLDG